MEFVGFAASVAGLIQITGQVIVFASGYIGKVKRASEEINNLVSELASLSTVVKKLEHLGDKYPPNSTELQKLDISLRECDIKLQELRLKLDNGMKRSRLRKAFRSLKWPLEEAETTQFMAYIERRKSLFMIALSIDTFTISQSIEGQVVAVDRSVKDIQSKIQVVSEAQNDEKISRDKIKRKEALNWLYPDDFDKKHIDISNRRKKGTGEWFLNSQMVQNWVTGSHSSRLLWGYGIPGAGKTFISCGVIDHLTNQAGSSDGVAYIYFDYKERDDQTPIRVLESLVKQLGYQIPYLPQKISTLYDELEKKGKRPTMEELIIVLLSLFTSFKRVFIVFDALDECNQNGQRNKLLPLFHNLGEGGANVFITSRHYPEDIQASFKDVPKIEIAASGQDIESYVLQELRENPRVKHLAEQGGCEDRIVSELTERAKGMFLVVRFHVEYLCQQTTVKQLLSALESFGTKDSYTDKPPLDPTYDRVLETIRQQPRRLSELAMKTLSWVVKAQRALTVEEIQIAVSIDLESRSLDELDFPDKATLIEVCAGLITIDESNVIRLAHLTVQEYLLRSTVLLPEMDYEIAATCMTYFSLDICIVPKEMVYKGPEDYTFREYVVRYLVHHLKYSDEARSMPRILEFLKLGEKVVLWVLWSLGLTSIGFGGWREPLAGGCIPFHVAVCMGNCLVVQHLLDEGFNILSLDRYKRSAAHWAALSGQPTILRLLLDHGAEISGLDGANYMAVHYASSRGYDKVVKLLLDHGVGASDAATYDKPLRIAVERGHEVIVKLLLDYGADISAKDGYGGTLLNTAIYYGHKGITRLLLDHGADISAKSDDGDTPLHTAASHGHKEMVRLLLDYGADTSAKNGSEDTPLHNAVLHGHKEIVELLLDHGADTSAKDDGGYTPLHTAVFSGHREMVGLLLDHGADTSAKNSYGDTPLHTAASHGHKEMVRLLLDYGADISAKNDGGDTPLLIAAYMDTKR